MDKIKVVVVAFFVCISFNAISQQTNITGKIIDTEAHLPVKNAVVMVLSLKDSTLITFARTQEDGTYELKNVPAGKNILMITHPIYGDYVDGVNFKIKMESLSTIALTSKSKLLEAIIIKTGGAIRIKGDTTIYTADSFNVSANANVEELLKKLPGIQVDKNGEIKAMGEKVQKVLVDGEEFFGDDPGMAVKNLRADAVKEVQVFDKKTEQAEFTGIDDGNTQKTINLKLKEDKKKGYFGKVSLAGGIGKDISNRFNNNLLLGSFKGKRKLSGFILNGNTGQDGLTWQENQKYGNSEDNNFEMMDEDGIFAFSITRTGDEEIYINPENGFLRNVNAGLQYSNKWKDKHNFNFSPKYNEQDYSNVKNTNTITQLGDSSLNENQETHTRINRYNIKNTAIYDVKIDTNNSLKMTWRMNYFHVKNSENSDAVTTGSTGFLKNSSIRNISAESDKSVLSGNVIFKHRFAKARRTLSFTADWNNNVSNAQNYLNSENTIYDFIQPVIIDVDQFTKSTNNSNKISAKLNYTEPLSKKWSMEIAYELSDNLGKNNQSTYTKSNGAYDIPVDSLTNDFKQSIIIHTPSAKFNFAYKKIKFNFGSGFGITHYDLVDLTINKDYLRKYTNLFPSATFVYNYKSNHSLRIKYNGSSSQPTINQLQPLRNNNNVFYQYIGNPDLKPSFANNFNITHNGYNFFKNLWNYQSLNITFTENSITDNKIIDPISGGTIAKPTNTNGNISINLWSGLGFKLKKSEIEIEVSPNLNFSRFADIINNVTSFSNTTSGGLNIGMRKSKADKYDFSLNNQMNITYNTNAQTLTSNTFRNNTLIFGSTIYYKKVWSVVTDYLFYARQKLAGQTENLNNNMINLKLQRTFNKNEFTVYTKVVDLLNQNIGIDRNYYGNVFTEERNQRLKRYFMIGFSWDFKNKNTSVKK